MMSQGMLCGPKVAESGSGSVGGTPALTPTLGPPEKDTRGCKRNSGAAEAHFDVVVVSLVRLAASPKLET
jgi:orotidine-5'-phosphate decarboxylase